MASLPTQNSFIQNSFLRLRQVLALIPVSKSAWYLGIQQGLYPKPVKLSERTSAWRSADIASLIERLGAAPQPESRSPKKRNAKDSQRKAVA
jgi:predicted DNA-binding transcriptional regulator AlpA